MLTPRFSLDQTDDSLTVRIYAPFTHVADTEVFFDDLDFRFYSRPYFLRLHLPAPVQETDDAEAHFDAETKSFVVTVPKKVKGQHFAGLDMITDLLIPKGDTKLPEGPLVQEIGGDDDDQPEEEIDCYFDQQVPQDELKNDEEAVNNGYGFAFKQKGALLRLLDECQHVFEIQNLDDKPFKVRRKERLENESRGFSADHYLADLYDPPDTLTECLRLGAPPDTGPLDDTDRDRMVQLAKRKRVDLSPSEHLSVCFGMLDILYSYSYEVRTSLFDGLGTESSWTIQKLASTLSCGERFTSIKQVVVAALRRTVCYPLFRHFQLGVRVWDDVTAHLLTSPQKIVKVFLQLIPQFVDENYGHLFNQLYIEDYAVWVQTLTQETLADLKKALDHVLAEVTKSDLDLELEEFEHAAQLTMKEVDRSQNQSVEDLLKKLDIGKGEDSDDTGTDDSDSDSSDSEDSSDGDSSDSDDGSSDESVGECNPKDTKATQDSLAS